MRRSRVVPRTPGSGVLAWHWGRRGRWSALSATAPSPLLSGAVPAFESVSARAPGSLRWRGLPLQVGHRTSWLWCACERLARALAGDAVCSPGTLHRHRRRKCCADPMSNLSGFSALTTLSSSASCPLESPPVAQASARGHAVGCPSPPQLLRPVLRRASKAIDNPDQVPGVLREPRQWWSKNPGALQALLRATLVHPQLPHLAVSGRAHRRRGVLRPRGHGLGLEVPQKHVRHDSATDSRMSTTEGAGFRRCLKKHCVSIGEVALQTPHTRRAQAMVPSGRSAQWKGQMILR